MSERFENGFNGLVAVVTGGGTGMGRELVRQLTADGCDVATCDVVAENLDETIRMCREDGNKGEVLQFIADVSTEADMYAFRDAVAQWRPHVNILFNNAGIGAGGGFVAGPRDEWEKTFNVCFYGVYYGCRAFLDLLLAAPFGQVVNTSSVNGLWASLGPSVSHTAYSAAKFAVRGFTEALMTDFANNAPSLRAAVVMPGHIGTSIAINSGKLLGNSPQEMSSERIAQARARFEKAGVDMSAVSDDEMRSLMQMGQEAFRDNAPMTAAEAATVILNGIKNNEWRILVGEDAKVLDEMVRANPWDAYTPEFHQQLQARGAFGALTR
jgi:NAD(P)-dependent dehydrogenase (short-subunit alcohol dehydrogenase family)